MEAEWWIWKLLKQPNHCPSRMVVRSAYGLWIYWRFANRVCWWIKCRRKRMKKNKKETKVLACTTRRMQLLTEMEEESSNNNTAGERCQVKCQAQRLLSLCLCLSGVPVSGLAPGLQFFHIPFLDPSSRVATAYRRCLTRNSKIPVLY